MFKILFFIGLVAMAYTVPAPVPKPAAKSVDVVPVVYDPELPNPVRFYDQPHQMPVQLYSPSTYIVHHRSYAPLFYSQYYV